MSAPTPKTCFSSRKTDRHGRQLGTAGDAVAEEDTSSLASPRSPKRLAVTDAEAKAAINYDDYDAVVELVLRQLGDCDPVGCTVGMEAAVGSVEAILAGVNKHHAATGLQVRFVPRAAPPVGAVPAPFLRFDAKAAAPHECVGTVAPSSEFCALLDLVERRRDRTKENVDEAALCAALAAYLAADPSGELLGTTLMLDDDFVGTLVHVAVAYNLYTFLSALLRARAPMDRLGAAHRLLYGARMVRGDDDDDVPAHIDAIHTAPWGLPLHFAAEKCRLWSVVQLVVAAHMRYTNPADYVHALNVLPEVADPTLTDAELAARFDGSVWLSAPPAEGPSSPLLPCSAFRTWSIGTVRQRVAELLREAAGPLRLDPRSVSQVFLGNAMHVYGTKQSEIEQPAAAMAVLVAAGGVGGLGARNSHDLTPLDNHLTFAGKQPFGYKRLLAALVRLTNPGVPTPFVTVTQSGHASRSMKVNVNVLY